MSAKGDNNVHERDLSLKKLRFDLQNVASMSPSFTSEITHCTSSFVTRLTFGFFRIGFSGALCLFPAVAFEVEVDAWKQPFSCWSRVVQSQWQKLRRLTHYDVKGLYGCSKNFLIRFCWPQFHFNI